VFSVFKYKVNRVIIRDFRLLHESYRLLRRYAARYMTLYK